MLTNEYFKITTNISNDFHVALDNVGISITVPSHLRNKGKQRRSEQIEIHFQPSMYYVLTVYFHFIFLTVFIAADLTKTRQKLLSNFQMAIGSVPPQASKSITFSVISLIEGTIELSQKLWYQMDPNVAASSGQLAASKCDESAISNASVTIQQRKQQHNISIEQMNDVLVKSKKDTISIPCTAEFLFSGKFYSLNKEALTRAFIGEDFLFSIDLEVKSVAIDILDMFLISVSKVDSIY